MSEYIQNLGGAAGFTTIRAKIPCHSLKVYQDGARNKAFIYKRKDDGTDDGFQIEFTTQAGDPITILGHGRSGIIGRPPNYNGYNHILGHNEPQEVASGVDDTGGGDVILMIKASDDSTPDVVVNESVNEL